MSVDEQKEKLSIAQEAEVRKRCLADCIHNLNKFLNSRTWEIFAHKFRQLNIKLPPDLVSCKVCEDPYSGHYFEREKKIVICANHVTDDQFDYTVTHELVHVYDDARAEVDFDDPEHIACSEIRATNLSGECREAKFYEFWRRNNKYIDCVRSRAYNSMTYNKKDLSKETAEKAIANAWEVCYFDYEPFSFEELKKKLSGRKF